MSLKGFEISVTCKVGSYAEESKKSEFSNVELKDFEFSAGIKLDETSTEMEADELNNVIKGLQEIVHDSFMKEMEQSRMRLERDKINKCNNCTKEGYKE